MNKYGSHIGLPPTLRNANNQPRQLYGLTFQIV
jgi:hypothetical protein